MDLSGGRQDDDKVRAQKDIGEQQLRSWEDGSSGSARGRSLMQITQKERDEVKHEASAERDNALEETSPRTRQTPATDQDQHRNEIVVQKNAFEPGREVIVRGAKDEELFAALDRITTVSNGNLTKALLASLAQTLPTARELVFKA